MTACDNWSRPDRMASGLNCGARQDVRPMNGDMMSNGLGMGGVWGFWYFGAAVRSAHGRFGEVCLGGLRPARAIVHTGAAVDAVGRERFEAAQPQAVGHHEDG